MYIRACSEGAAVILSAPGLAWQGDEIKWRRLGKKKQRPRPSVSPQPLGLPPASETVALGAALGAAGDSFILLAGSNMAVIKK